MNKSNKQSTSPSKRKPRAKTTPTPAAQDKPATVSRYDPAIQPSRFGRPTLLDSRGFPIDTRPQHEIDVAEEEYYQYIQSSYPDYDPLVVGRLAELITRSIN